MMRRAASTATLDATRIGIFAQYLETTPDGPDCGPEVLSRALLDSFYAHLRTVRGNSIRTANGNLGAVLMAWRWLSDHDELSHGVPRAPMHYDTPQPSATPTVAPTWAQVDAMIAELRGVPPVRLATIQRYTGLRIGQVARLLWSDFDLSGHAHGVPTVYIRPALGKTASERRGRLLPITPHLADVMSTWGVREGLVVPEHRVQPVHTFQRAWTRAGIDPRAWRRRSSHAIRKAFRSGLRHAGADSDAIEAYMGHAGGLLDVYTDPRALPMLDLVERIPRIGEAGVDFQAARWGKRADG